MRASGATCTQRTASGRAGTSAGVHGSPIASMRMKRRSPSYEMPKTAVVVPAHVVDRRAERLDLRHELVAILGRAARVDARLHLEPAQRAGAVERPAADPRRPVGHQVAGEVAEHGDHARKPATLRDRHVAGRAGPSSTIAR